MSHVIVDRIAAKVAAIAGIELGAAQRPMVETRLKKRMLDLGMSTLEDYGAYFDAHEAEEVDSLVSALTTHYTFFFREFPAFDYLAEEGLAHLIASARARGQKRLKVWSAACSRGHEVYSLAMFLHLHLKSLAPDFTFEVVGTDIDPESISYAKNGVYPRRELNQAPLHYLGNHWAKGTGDIADFAKAKATLREVCRFEVSNLLQAGTALPGEKFDLILCRNVFIYFEQKKVKEIAKGLISHLVDGGVFISGTSENLRALDLPLKTEAPSIYRLPPPAPLAPKPAPAPAAAKAHSGPLRVLCVDDSNTVLTLLKKILDKEHGFQVVKTAMNGLEAAKVIKAGGIDLMTLDIHMPEQDGLTYLKTNFKQGHPPVLMISSVSRDSAELATECLRLGATDYVEKPTMANLQKVGEEIRSKLKSAARKLASTTDLSLEKSFGKADTPTASDKGRVRLLIFAEGFEADARRMAQSFHSQIPVQVLSEKDWHQKSSELVQKHKSDLASILLVGRTSEQTVRLASQWKGSQILIDEKSGLKGTPQSENTQMDFVPATSFVYMSDRFLKKVA